MDSKELRIGNYVNARANWNDGKHHYEAAEVTEIEEDDFLTTATGIDGSCQDKEMCKPIPLTEEWAVRLGKTINGLKVQSSGYPDGDLYIDNEGEGYYLYNCSDGYRFGKKIKYVHELQNLYFALTNEELTIK